MDKVDKDAQVKKEQDHVETRDGKRQVPVWLPWVAVGLAALLIGMIGYTIGNHAGRNGLMGRSGLGSGIARVGADDLRSTGGMNYRGRGMVAGSIGEVTAVSADSITIKDTMRGGSVTYKIDSNTKVTENGTTKAVSDIKTGNTVRVTATGSDTTIATTILLGTN